MIDAAQYIGPYFMGDEKGSVGAYDYDYKTDAYSGYMNCHLYWLEYPYISGKLDALIYAQKGELKCR